MQNQLVIMQQKQKELMDQLQHETLNSKQARENSVSPHRSRSPSKNSSSIIGPNLLGSRTPRVIAPDLNPSGAAGSQ